MIKSHYIGQCSAIFVAKVLTCGKYPVVATLSNTTALKGSVCVLLCHIGVLIPYKRKARLPVKNLEASKKSLKTSFARRLSQHLSLTALWRRLGLHLTRRLGLLLNALAAL